MKGAFVDALDVLLQKDWPQSLGCRGFRLMSVHVIERKYRQKHVEVACWVYRVSAAICVFRLADIGSICFIPFSRSLTV